MNKYVPRAPVRTEMKWREMSMRGKKRKKKELNLYAKLFEL